MSALDYKQIIVLRKDLNMRKGKMVAQGAHASLGVLLKGGVFGGQVTDQDGGSLTLNLTPGMRAWLEGRFTKICVSVGSEAELIAIHDKALASGLPAVLIKDAGLTEFGGVPTFTAVAIGPDHKDKIDPVTGHLPLL